MRAVALLAGLLLAGCATSRAPLPTDATAVLPALEARLLDAPTLRVDYAFTLVGRSPSAVITGLLAFGARDRALLVGDVRIGRETNQYVLASDEERLRGMRADSTFFESDPLPTLREWVVSEYVRRGFQFLLAELTLGHPPGHAFNHENVGFDNEIIGGGGSIAQQVVPHSVAWGGRRTLEGRTAQALRFRLHYVDADVYSEEVTLWLDTATGLPLRRSQAVRFSNSMMTVTEFYRSWSLSED